MSLPSVQNPELKSLSLYRRYRPQVFSEVVGQEHVTHTLSNALKAKPPRVNHAYLFCGPRGTGKTTTARLLAKGLNCEQGPTADPCCKCEMCLRIARGSAMDVLEIDAASNTGVDKVRDVIIEKVNYAPAEGRYRVYIIDEVHQLSLHAFNALLKTLEEPPPHVVFILATTETHKVPGTILSRCQRFDFRPLSPEHVMQCLTAVAKAEGLEIEPSALARIARAADGSARDALGLLEQAAAYTEGTVTEFEINAVLGSVGSDLLWEMGEALIHQDTRAAIKLLHQATNQGKDIQQMFIDLGNYLRDLLLISLGCDSQEINVLPPDTREKMKQQASLCDRGTLADFIDELCRAEREMRVNSQHRLIAEMTLFRCTQDIVPTSLRAPQQEQQLPTAPSQPATVRERLLPRRQAATSFPASPSAETSDLPPAEGTEALWSQVLAAVRKQSLRLHALLLDATLVEQSDDSITLTFANQFHYDQIAENIANKEAVEEIITQLRGKPTTLRCNLGESDSRSRRTPTGSRADSASDVSEGVEAAMSLFDAQVISERPSNQTR